MYAIQLDWKEYNVSLPLVDQWAKATFPNYVGNSADYKLNLWFAEEPSEYEKQLVQDYWDAATDESEVATSYVSQTSIVGAIEALKGGLLSKTWDQMTIAERKIILGQTPTNEELGL